MDRQSLQSDLEASHQKKAFDEKAAEITMWLVGSTVAVGWVGAGLIAVGANPVVAIILGIVLLVAFPTIIGGFVGVGLTASIFDIAPFGLVLRILVAYVLGAVIGNVASFIAGYSMGRFKNRRGPG